MYAAYTAAHHTMDIQQVSIVGYDFPKEEMEQLSSRGVNVDGVEIVADKNRFSGVVNIIWT